MSSLIEEFQKILKDCGTKGYEGCYVCRINGRKFKGTLLVDGDANSVAELAKKEAWKE